MNPPHSVSRYYKERYVHLKEAVTMSRWRYMQYKVTGTTAGAGPQSRAGRVTQKPHGDRRGESLVGALHRPLLQRSRTMCHEQDWVGSSADRDSLV